ncbi:hypothetical protein XENOCAPTIV_014663, partial [Xenoophorus captivus]
MLDSPRPPTSAGNCVKATLRNISSVCVQVSNYLPSISSAISRTPELYIWRSCIGLHSAPRYLVAVAYFNFYRGRFAARLPELLLSCLALICSVAENTGLVLLTYVASTEAYSESADGDPEVHTQLWSKFNPFVCWQRFINTASSCSSPARCCTCSLHADCGM